MGGAVRILISKWFKNTRSLSWDLAVSESLPSPCSLCRECLWKSTILRLRTATERTSRWMGFNAFWRFWIRPERSSLPPDQPHHQGGPQQALWKEQQVGRHVRPSVNVPHFV